jgi:hypothetical protein
MKNKRYNFETYKKFKANCRKISYITHEKTKQFKQLLNYNFLFKKLKLKQ